MIRAIFTTANNVAKYPLLNQGVSDTPPPPLSKADNSNISKHALHNNNNKNSKLKLLTLPYRPELQIPPVPTNEKDSKFSESFVTPLPIWNSLKLPEESMRLINVKLAIGTLWFM